MDEHQKQLIDYIRHQLDNGASAEEVAQALTAAGWSSDRVQHAMQTVTAAAKPEPAAAPAQALTHPQPSNHYPIAEPLMQPAAAQQNTANPAQPAGDVPRKYKVFRSIVDSFKAMANNFPAYISAAVSSFLISGLVLSVIIILSLIIGTALVANAPIAGLIVIPVVFLLLFILIYPLALAFMTAAVSYPLMSGAEHRQDNILTVLKHAFRRTPKLALTTITIYVISVGPLLGLMVLAVLATLAIRSYASIFIVLLAYIGGLAWVIVASLRYALTPYVILFNETLTIRQALNYSRYLLLQGGRWFLMKGYFLVFIIALLLSWLTGANTDSSLQSDNTWGVDIVFAVLMLLVNNSLVMLYRNRRIVRGNTQQDQVPTQTGSFSQPALEQQPFMHQ